MRHSDYAINPSKPYKKWCDIPTEQHGDRWRLASELYFQDSSFNCLRSGVSGALVTTNAQSEAEAELLVPTERSLEAAAERELAEYYMAKRQDTYQLLLSNGVPRRVARRIMYQRDNVFLSNAIGYRYNLPKDVVEVRRAPPLAQPATIACNLTHARVQRVEYASWILDFMKRERSYLRARTFQHAYACHLGNLLQGPSSEHFGKGIIPWG